MYFDEPILITGCARSGTSLTAGVIHLCGAWGGAMRGATPYNQKGMFENIAIINELVKPYLHSIGSDPMGQDPLPDTENVPVIPEWDKAILRRIEKQGYSGQRWFYKGAKMCLMWPVWHAAFPRAKWIIVRRDAGDIADSCLRTPFMRAFNDREGWLEWVRGHEERFEQMQRAGLNIYQVWATEAAHEISFFKEMINWLELDWNAVTVTDFVEPRLLNQR